MKKSFVSIIMVVTIGAVCLTSCNDYKSNSVVAPKATVQIANNATFGKILTDNAGKTLYFFSRDTKGASVCDAGCTASWPVFYTDNLVIDSPDLSMSDFNTITRSDGNKQTTYKGYPLYHFNQDAQAGDVKGENTGNIWFVAKPDYSVSYSKAQLVGHNGVSYKGDFTPGTEETSYLTDSKGRTLYLFTNDKNKTNNFTTNPANNPAVWPIFPSAISTLVVPSVFNKADFSELTVNGLKQLTYKGWPLYFFGGNATVAGDVNPGDTRGVSFPSPGVWHVVNTSTNTAPNP